MGAENDRNENQDVRPAPCRSRARAGVLAVTTPAKVGMQRGARRRVHCPRAGPRAGGARCPSGLGRPVGACPARRFSTADLDRLRCLGRAKIVADLVIREHLLLPSGRCLDPRPHRPKCRTNALFASICVAPPVVRFESHDAVSELAPLAGSSARGHIPSPSLVIGVSDEDPLRSEETTGGGA